VRHVFLEAKCHFTVQQKTRILLPTASSRNKITSSRSDTIMMVFLTSLPDCFTKAYSTKCLLQFSLQFYCSITRLLLMGCLRTYLISNILWPAQNLTRKFQFRHQRHQVMRFFSSDWARFSAIFLTHSKLLL